MNLATMQTLGIPERDSGSGRATRYRLFRR